MSYHHTKITEILANHGTRVVSIKAKDSFNLRVFMHLNDMQYINWPAFIQDMKDAGYNVEDGPDVNDLIVSLIPAVPANPLPEVELTREERMWLAGTLYGQPLVGIATTLEDKLHEDSAMDALNVPRIRSKLKPNEVASLQFKDLTDRRRRDQDSNPLLP